MVELGKRSILTVTRESQHGIYVDGEELGEILVPSRYVPPGARAGDQVDVFVYLDSEDRLVATTEVPHAMVGEFALLTVVSVNRHIGMFLDWGLAKDLLLPFRELEEPVTTGQKIVVYVYVDEKSNRIVATTRLYRHLSRERASYPAGEKVNVLVTSKTPLGYNAIVEGTYWGLLYHTNLSGPLEIGQTMEAYVSAPRADGKIDLRLDPSGYQRVASLTDRIIEALKANDGKMALDDKSPPEVIRKEFGASKKAFKQALGALYKKRKIDFVDSGIQLIAPPPKGKKK